MTLLRMRSSAIALAALTPLLAVAAGCNSPAGPSAYSPYLQNDIRVGTGAQAAAGSTLTVNYTGWLYDGTKPDSKGAAFGSSVGGTPLTFTLGIGQVIAGWDQGLVGMQEGGLRRLVIPPSLGYGSARYGIIPPNATLLFDVELIEVKG